MFKNFSDFNTWLSSHFSTEISAVVTRAVNRVTAIRQRMSQIHSEYTSAYNSVQTLGYDSQGSIVDNTSADRLSIPESTLTKCKAYLQTQRESLAADRDSFIDLYGAAGQGALPFISSSIPSGATIIIANLYGFGQIVINTSTNSARVVVDQYAFVAIPQIGVSDGGSGYLPFIWFGDGMDWQSGIYASQRHPGTFSGGPLQWRASLTNRSSGYKFVTVEIKLANGVVYAVSGDLSTVDNTTGTYATDNLQIGHTALFNTVTTYRQFINQRTGVSLGTKYGTFEGDIDTPSKILYNNLSTGQKQFVDAIFSSAVTANAKTAYIISKANSAVAGDMFDITMSLTPSDIDNAIALL